MQTNIEKHWSQIGQSTELTWVPFVSFPGGWRFIIAGCPFIILVNYMRSYFVSQCSVSHFTELQRNCSPDSGKNQKWERTKEQVHRPQYAGKEVRHQPFSYQFTATVHGIFELWHWGWQMGLDKILYKKLNIKAGKGLNPCYFNDSYMQSAFSCYTTSGMCVSVTALTRMHGNYSLTYVHNSEKREITILYSLLVFLRYA